MNAPAIWKGVEIAIDAGFKWRCIMQNVEQRDVIRSCAIL